MILSFMILSPKPGQNHEGQNHGEDCPRSGIFVAACERFDGCSPEAHAEDAEKRLIQIREHGFDSDNDNT
jgi:hypothetical protein